MCKVTLNLYEDSLKDPYFFYSPEVSLNNCTPFLPHQGSLHPKRRNQTRARHNTHIVLPQKRTLGWQIVQMYFIIKCLVGFYHCQSAELLCTGHMFWMTLHDKCLACYTREIKNVVTVCFSFITNACIDSIFFWFLFSAFGQNKLFINPHCLTLSDVPQLNSFS